MVADRGILPTARTIWRDKWLLGASLVLLWQARLAMTLRGFGDPLGRCSEAKDLPPADPPLAQRIAWSIDRAARLTPGATCLVRARAGQRLLALKHRGSVIRVGVRQGASSAVEAHAWLVSGGRIVLGGSESELADYRLLIGAG